MSYIAKQRNRKVRQRFMLRCNIARSLRMVVHAD